MPCTEHTCERVQVCGLCACVGLRTGKGTPASSLLRLGGRSGRLTLRERQAEGPQTWSAQEGGRRGQRRPFPGSRHLPLGPGLRGLPSIHGARVDGPARQSPPSPSAAAASWPQGALPSGRGQRAVAAGPTAHLLGLSEAQGLRTVLVGKSTGQYFDT